ncbi:MAG: hypothetical protein P8185_04260 [Deltaproteobacteria bacterium]
MITVSVLASICLVRSMEMRGTSIEVAEAAVGPKGVPDISTKIKKAAAKTFRVIICVSLCFRDKRCASVD